MRASSGDSLGQQRQQLAADCSSLRATQAMTWLMDGYGWPGEHGGSRLLRLANIAYPTAQEHT